MISSPHRRWHRFFWRYPFFWICLLLLLSSASFLIFFRQGRPAISRWGFSAISSVQKTAWWVGNEITQTFQLFREKRKLLADYEENKRQLLHSRGLRHELEILRKENNALRTLLNFSQRTEFVNIPAEIIGRDPGGVFSSILINRGKKEGVKEGMPVVAFQKNLLGLVGKVETVGAYTALVKPLFDSSVSVGARSIDGNYLGLVEGKNPSLLLMRYVETSRKKSVKKGDLIETASVSSRYPVGIAIGRVIAIKSRIYDTSLTLHLEPVVDFWSLKYLLVLEEKGDTGA